MSAFLSSVCSLEPLAQHSCIFQMCFTNFLHAEIAVVQCFILLFTYYKIVPQLTTVNMF